MTKSRIESNVINLLTIDLVECEKKFLAISNSGKRISSKIKDDYKFNIHLLVSKLREISIFLFK